MILIGTIEDNVELFAAYSLMRSIRSVFISNIGFPYGKWFSVLDKSNPLFTITYYLFSRIFDVFYAYNFLLVLILVLNVAFATRFFGKVLGNKVIGFLLAMIFVSAPYFRYQSLSHIDLCMMWLFFITLDLLFFKKNPVLVGVFVGVTFLFTNYLGLFTSLFVLVFYSLESFFSYLKTKKFGSIFSGLKNILLCFLVTSILIAPSSLSYVKANYSRDGDEDKRVIRTIGDFVIFSSRPHYLFLPPVDNPFFGRFSSKVLEGLKGTNYLFDNYFKFEHSSGYLGMTNVILSIVGLSYVIRTRKIQDYSKLLVLGVSLIFIILFSFPPFFVFKGITIYLPSFFILKMFPMFRVLSRLNIYIIAIFLVFVGYGYKSILSSHSSKKFGYAFVLPILFALSFLEFYIPPKFTRMSGIPPVYSSLAEDKGVVAIYPYNMTNIGYLWGSLSGVGIVNPRNYERDEYNFNAEEFTKNLNTCGGLQNLQKFGATHLVYYFGDDKEHPENVGFFDTYLIREAADYEYEESCIIRSDALFRIYDLGQCRENSVILYQLPGDVIDCI